MAAPDSATIRLGLIVLIIVLFVLYGIFYIGIVGLLFSVAIGLIVYSFEFPVELTIAIILLSGIVWKSILSKLMLFCEIVFRS